MRFSLVLLAGALALTGCKKDDGNNGDDTTVDSGNGSGSGSGDPNAAFTIQSTDVTIHAGQEVTYCYYFHTPNTSQVIVNKWVADMTPGSHHMIFYTGGPDHAEGIDTSNSCGLGTSVQNVSKWVFASQTEHLEEDLPDDDGTGKPLAQVIAPNTLGAFQMHYLNSTDGDLVVHVKLAAYALADGTPYTQTDAYITYNQDISIPAHSTGTDAPATCKTPPGAKFWTVSTHSHKQSVETTIKDASSGMVFDSTDWEHPGTKDWMTMPFYTFPSDKLTINCHYKNDGETAPPDNSANTITAGPSAQTNEMCMATGYYFPATAPYMCINYSGTCYCQ